MPNLEMRRSNTVIIPSLLSATSIEVHNVVDEYYDKAYKKFTKAEAHFGLARQLILKSEFLVDNPK